METFIGVCLASVYAFIQVGCSNANYYKWPILMPDVQPKFVSS